MFVETSEWKKDCVRKITLMSMYIVIISMQTTPLFTCWNVCKYWRCMYMTTTTTSETRHIRWLNFLHKTLICTHYIDWMDKPVTLQIYNYTIARGMCVCACVCKIINISVKRKGKSVVTWIDIHTHTHSRTQ